MKSWPWSGACTRSCASAAQVSIHNDEYGAMSDAELMSEADVAFAAYRCSRSRRGVRFRWSI